MLFQGVKMGYPTKVQCIKRATSEQWFINIPAVLAKALEFQQSEEVEWIISDKGHLILQRKTVPPGPIEVMRPGIRRY